VIEKLIEKLETSITTLEITPPKGSHLDETLDSVAKISKLARIDGFTVTDNPLAKLKYSSTLASIKVQNRFEKPVICTMSMRDKNKLALQSDLLGLNDFGIRAVLALTGDPANISDQPNVKGVFEGNSIELVRAIKFLNAGVDFAGKPLKYAPKPIYPFCVTNSYGKNFGNIQKKIYKKIEAGCVAIVSQPVFDIDGAKKLLSVFDEARGEFDDKRAECKLVFGVFPIVTLKTAQFLHAHVPGIYVPQTLLDKLFEASKQGVDEERKVGLAMSKNLIKELKIINPRLHLMTANKFDFVDELLD
jgi:methylenetetrahydrofolate reductase (NADPH)